MSRRLGRRLGRRLRMALGMASVAVVLISLLMLAYAMRPAGQSPSGERATLAPTLFAPPVSP